MINKQQITSLVEEKIKDTEIFLVDITVGKGSLIYVKVDKPSGITLEECISISRFVEGNLDREKDDFSLEVSSPGVGEILKVEQQFLKCIGRHLQIQDTEGAKKTGKLLNLSNGEIEIECEEKIKNPSSSKKKTELIVYKYQLSNITAKEIILFK